MSLGYFKSARISFEEQAPAARQPATADPSADTLALPPLREGALTCNILCTPTLRQSFKIDLEGSTTSSFYGLKATVGYQNRNIFRGAESFDISFTTGYEFMKAPDAKKKRATEFGVTTSLTFPRFLLPWRAGRFESVNQPRTKVGAVDQLPGPSLLPPHAVECRHHLPVVQQQLLLLLAAPRGHQRGRRDGSRRLVPHGGQPPIRRARSSRRTATCLRVSTRSSSAACRSDTATTTSAGIPTATPRASASIWRPRAT